QKSLPQDPSGPADGVGRVLRGGDWHNTEAGCRVARRYGGRAPSFRDSSIGFRVAVVNIGDLKATQTEASVRRVIRFDPARDATIGVNVALEDGGWKIAAPNRFIEAKDITRLFELRDAKVENCTVTLRAQMKTANN